MTPLPSCTDYITAIETPQLLKAEKLRGGNVTYKNGKTIRYAGGFCVVFPFIQKDGTKVAVRCWTAHVPDAEKRSNFIAKRITESKLPYFVGFEYIQLGLATSLGVYPVILMDWVDAKPLKEYLKLHINDSNCLASLASEFKTMVSDLHKVDFSHGDLQHGNIMVSEDGHISLVDYDSMYVPGLDGVTDEIKGLEGYQHPARIKLKHLSPKTDYFSELIIYTSILALSKYPKLWEELEIEDTETLVFSQYDINVPYKSNVFRKLKSDPDLSNCIQAIEDALKIDDIESLQPLELAIIPQSTLIIDGLKSKWNNPIAQQTQHGLKADIKSLSDKWSKHVNMNTNQVIDTTSITNKWK